MKKTTTTQNEWTRLLSRFDLCVHWSKYGGHKHIYVYGIIILIINSMLLLYATHSSREQSSMSASQKKKILIVSLDDITWDRLKLSSSKNLSKTALFRDENKNKRDWLLFTHIHRSHIFHRYAHVIDKSYKHLLYIFISLFAFDDTSTRGYFYVYGIWNIRKVKARQGNCLALFGIYK